MAYKAYKPCQVEFTHVKNVRGKNIEALATQLANEVTKSCDARNWGSLSGRDFNKVIKERMATEGSYPNLKGDSQMGKTHRSISQLGKTHRTQSQIENIPSKADSQMAKTHRTQSQIENNPLKEDSQMGLTRRTNSQMGLTQQADSQMGNKTHSSFKKSFSHRILGQKFATECDEIEEEKPKSMFKAMPKAMHKPKPKDDDEESEFDFKSCFLSGDHEFVKKNRVKDVFPDPKNPLEKELNQLLEHNKRYFAVVKGILSIH